MSDVIITVSGRRLREVPERWDGALDRKSTCSNCVLGKEPIDLCREADAALRVVTNNRRASCVTRHSMYEAVDAS